MKRITIFSAILLLILLLFQASFSARAAEHTQLPQFATPTPGADGRIIYKVVDGDSCIRISLLTGVPVETLRALNRLDENCSLSVGQDLILGVGGPAAVTPTSGPAPTQAPVQPTATPAPGFATICVLLYNDLNGDAIRQDTEVVVEGGAVSVTGSTGQFSKTSDTVAGTDPICFKDVPEDSYTISAAAPEGYNATTQQSTNLEVKAGEEVYVSFGAQQSTGPAVAPTTDTSGDNSMWIGIVGAFLFLGGIALGVYYWFVSSRAPRFGPPGAR